MSAAATKSSRAFISPGDVNLPLSYSRKLTTPSGFVLVGRRCGRGYAAYEWTTGLRVYDSAMSMEHVMQHSAQLLEKDPNATRRSLSASKALIGRAATKRGKANAALIIAAPYLLEALREMLAFYDPVWDEGFEPNEEALLARKAWNAVRKAEGGAA